ncbi:sensor domain-containing diguanylate cyclase [Butyrivibrio sp. NC3005]|uniref:sensor domain-containing diguanylate cyclase n=1 Tax=Butyrivibrio sp. NC3005 TaxID=1280685 RepID=UPI0004174EF4|nr:EAL domain-containing protein [Butyrivibrio sp. NC3005]
MQKYKYTKEELKLIESSVIPIAIYQFINKRVVTIALSDGFRTLIGMKTFEEAYYVMDNDMYRDVHPEDVAKVADAAVRFATEGGDYNILYRSKKGNDYMMLHAIGRHIYKDNGVRLAVINYINEGIIDDSQESKLFGNILLDSSFLANDKEKTISYDYLTGLPDMNYFFELAEEAKKTAYSEGKKMSMLFMDLSGMQAYNQRFGYSEGDILIQKVAKLLVRFFGNYNCCRVTADHFAVYTDKEKIDDILTVFIKELKSINDGKTLPVRIGVYNSKFAVVGPAIATDRAKIACDNCGVIFESKIKHFDEGMLKKFENRRYIFENIYKALNDNWIKVYYQPIVRASNGKVCNEEALVRWEDPVKGEMSPNDFIPILEDAKIAYLMDLYVVDQVVAKIKKQMEQGIFIVPNSVNLSRTDFYSCDIVEEIRKRVDDAGVNRSSIVIELTESVILNNTDFMKVQINRFRELGFFVWLDDFGSGYSTFYLLQKIHFDVIKFDKSFVDQIYNNEDSKIIITELVRMAKGLGSETVAEGVENEKTVDFLSEIGCTRLQGFYYSKAIPFGECGKRYEKEVNIDFENPSEAEYYSKLASVNMYDISMNMDYENVSLRNYFDTMPMFIVEVCGNSIRHVKGNKSYKQFMNRYYPDYLAKEEKISKNATDNIFFNIIKECELYGKPIITEIRGFKNDIIKLFVRKIATNTETKVVALSVVILEYIDNDIELRRKEELEKVKKERMAYSRVTALTGDFITIFAVDLANDHYIRYILDDNFEEIGMGNDGIGFFEKMRKKGLKLVYLDDVDHFLIMFSKENILHSIEQNGIFTLNLRIVIDKKPKYVCVKATIIEEDIPRLIVGVVDIDSQVKKDQEYYENIAKMSKIANFDSLTGVKNKHAYIDAEAKINTLIEGKEVVEFAIIVFDLNDLKVVNDTLGHQAGDNYIKEGCKVICEYFAHSPVYRIGGDEFVAIAQGHDYNNLENIMDNFRKLIIKNKKEGKVIVASGMARYEGDRSTASVFNRADKKMYINKKQLKDQAV